MHQLCKLLGNGIQEDYVKQELAKRKWFSTLTGATKRLQDVCETNASLETLQAHPPKAKTHAAAPSHMSKLEQSIKDLTQQVVTLTAAQPKLRLSLSPRPSP